MSDNSVNFYKTLDDFLDDMDERRKDKNKFVAIEFIYKGETYRINNGEFYKLNLVNPFDL